MVQRFGQPGLYYWSQGSKASQEDDIMNSPLPDSSTLEAGIIEDERPSRLSRVQDNVRNLLRTSVFGSVKSSPTTPTHPATRAARTPPTGPPRATFQCDVLSDRLSTPHVPPLRFNARAEVAPGPSTSSSSSSSATHLSETVAAFPCPPQSYQERVQRMAHQSALFNTRAVAALNHPDLSDSSMEQLSEMKEQRRCKHAWRRQRRSRKVAQHFAGSGAVLCLLASLLLAALVATYVTIATTQQDLTSTFHVLFVLGICLATIVFAYSVVRLFLVERRSRSRPMFVPVSRHGRRRENRHHHHHHHHHRPPHLRRLPVLASDAVPFVPPTPIPVHVSSDDVRLDANEAIPTTAAAQGEDWDKHVESVANPPPAYGRWRGSVRADPELLHWQAVPSPLSPHTPVLASPTYEEAMTEEQNVASPPSYITRESPVGQQEPEEERAGIAPTQAAEPEVEMVEVRGVGIGLVA